ncbi:MAG: hypothetical protein HY222_02650 [Thaumarchaeota archaeon]|nr:hypothetical protein [Nitrososphaerota archaeon]MBI3641274.1 hypothetical protein [Nitrososphaerota archaeon]
MMDSDKQHKVALISCFEVVLINRGYAKYRLVVSKLNSLYGYSLRDCYDDPKYLKTILKEVYKEDYSAIIEEIKLPLDELVKEKDMSDFFKIMES